MSKNLLNLYSIITSVLKENLPNFIINVVLTYVDFLSLLDSEIGFFVSKNDIDYSLP